ncbi:MAG: glycosyltransferase [Gemmataceae bacterium]|nr:glycosyltransferase [Gemmataceae bacterium]
MSQPQPEFVCRHPKPGCKLSVILIDWRVRESFHSLHYLNRQTLPRDQYELIWLEFYRHQPAALRGLAARNPGTLDQWLSAGYPDDCLYHKHRLYNLGLLLAHGEHVVICDSDAIFTPNFLARIVAHFEQSPRSVLHLDQVRNVRRRFYPFCYPSIAEVLGRGVRNWRGHTTAGLLPEADMIHACNYGACMAAPRQALMDLGGADESLGYLGYICGPYEMTFRLGHHGLAEHWLRDEFLYHAWHPNASGGNVEYHGPHDGAYVALDALEARALGRVLPLVENPWIQRSRLGHAVSSDDLLQSLAQTPEPAWQRDAVLAPAPRIAWIERDFEGFNVFYDGRRFHGIRRAHGVFDPARKNTYQPRLHARTAHRVRQLIRYYNRLPKDFWGKFWAEPLYKLPLRVCQKMGRELARLVEA